ncbi:MAG: B12-binding domain-containing radical SAM protein, partial [Candidatus Aminicenantes bacterium]|nr:B12-binding domain-containing radical SAM protein [Candidatus Aminicenantes bacterium]
ALVKLLIRGTFFCKAGDRAISELNRVTADFYTLLREYFIALLEREKPAVLGLSVYEGTLPASLFAAKIAKETYPDLQIVMGGGIFAEQLAKDSPNWELFLKKAVHIDKIIIGEGENLFLRLLQGELPQRQKIYTLKDIDEQTLDLADAPLPDFSDLQTDSYPYLASYSSRSCPFQCKFCSETVQWGKYRKKDVGQIAAEMLKLYEAYKGQLFLMCDSLLNPVITGLARELIKEKAALYWDGYLRADKETCDIENTMLWRRGGFYRARLGIESGSQTVLDLMGKKITPEGIKQAIANLAGAGIKTTTYWVVGYPGETEQAFRETLDLITELRNEIYEAWCSPFYYYPSGQVNSAAWQDKCSLLYPSWTKEMLVLQTYVQDGEPSREESYRRMNRFVEHCANLGVQNPFSLHEVYEADERWKKLQANAVPSLVDFEKKGDYVDDNRNVSKRFLAQSTQAPDGDFAF